MQPSRTNVTKNNFFNWELLDCCFPQSASSLCQKREAKRRNFRGAPGHPKRKERQSELLTKAHACILSPVIRVKARKAGQGSPCELRQHRICVLVQFLSCQHLTAVRRSIFYRETVQDPNSQPGHSGPSTAGTNKSQSFWSLSQATNPEPSGGLNGSVYGDHVDNQEQTVDLMP